MRVAVDSGPLSGGHSVRGIGFYTKNLVKALGELADNDIELEVVDFSTSSDEELATYDVLHYPYFDLFFNTLRIIKGPKIVVTIHDVIPLIYPKQYPPGIKGSINLWKQKQALKKVDCVITDSETSKKDIVRLLDFPAEKIEVIYLAAAGQYQKINNSKRLLATRKKFELDSNFVLYVGDVNYNKNVESLIEACVDIKMHHVIVGKHAIQIEEILNQSGDGIRDGFRKLNGKVHPEVSHLLELKELFRSKYVKRLGFVEDDDLVGLYNLASVYVFPSIYEGFGLSPLEAMACGCPVIINKSQTLVEISGDGALVVDVDKKRRLEEAIKKIISEKKISNELKEKGKRHVKNFSWEKTAKETLNVYKSL